MARNKFYTLSFALVLTVALTSCGNKTNDTNANRWEFSKESVANAQEMTFTTSTKDDNKNYLVANYEKLVNEPLTKDDVIFFDLGKAYKMMESEDYTSEYLDLDTMKACAIEYSEIKTDEDLTQFTLVAPKGSSNKACILVNKDKTASEKYLYATIGELLTANTKTPQEEFEEKYGRSNKAAIANSVTGLLTGIVTSIAGGIAGEPGLIAGGITTLITGISGFLTGVREPSLRDIMEKVYVIESRLKELDAKMTKNFDAVHLDNKLTQAKIDKVLMEQYQSNIDNFESKFLVDLNNYNNVINAACKTELKNVADQKNKLVQIPYYYNSENVLTYRPLTEVAANPSDLKVEVTIPSFPNTVDMLSKTGDIFNKQVYNEFMLDIYNATEGVTLPNQMTRELLADFIVARIVQEFTKKYYTGMYKSKSVDYMNYVINYADRISGTIGSSIITSYENRLKYMYNFGIEMKSSYNTVLARLRNFLDKNLVSCVEANIWAGNDYDALLAACDRALDTIINSAKNIDQIADYYSFVLEKNVSVNLYSSYTDSYFSKKGNYPTHYSKFRIFRYGNPNSDINTEVEYDNFRQVKSLDHYSIILRMNYLKSAGVVDKDTTYIKYLTLTDIVHPATADCISDGIAKKKIINNPYVFVTEINHRELTNDDTNVDCHITDAGTGDMHYFRVGETLKYKSRHSKEYWHATCWETVTIDGIKNVINEGKWMIGLEGCFDEGHARWRVDERFRFNGGENHNYFLAMLYEA